MTISYRQFGLGTRVSYKGAFATVVNAYVDERSLHPDNSVPVVFDDSRDLVFLIKESELTKV